MKRVCLEISEEDLSTEARYKEYWKNEARKFKIMIHLVRAYMREGSYGKTNVIDQELVKQVDSQVLDEFVCFWSSKKDACDYLEAVDEYE